MKASLRALLTGVIDYAGLFPPAKLPMAESLQNYVRYRSEPEAWMLGRFVVPAARLGEIELPQDTLPYVFSVLGAGGEEPTAYTRGILADINAVTAFCERWRGQAIVDAYEVKLPPATLGDRATTKLLAQHGMSVVYEIPLGSDWEDALSESLRHLAGGAAGVKIRTGGLESSAFPTPRQVATVIEQCRQYRLPLKCTAGLHHALRHFNEGVKAHMHGFLNVIVASVLAYTHGLVRNELEALLKCESPDAVVFEEGGIRYDGHHIGVDQLAAVRQEAFLSFGSCSFDEPRDDLRALGLL